VRVCPTVHGATNWWSPSLNQEFGLFYVVALNLKASPMTFSAGGRQYVTAGNTSP
jgi:hypothetical protein